MAGLLDLRFGDETAFNLNPNIPYGWGPIGQQQAIKCIKGGNLNVFGLLDVQNERLTSYCTQGRVNSGQMIEWLDDFAATLTKPTVVVLDNAPWHRSAAFLARLAQWETQQLFIYYLPPYCPHLNSIEITWRMMKYQWLRPKDFISQAALHQRIHYILANFQAPEFTLHYTKNKLAA